MSALVKVEAKKHAYRQTKDGIVISFVLHPNDVDAALAASPLGTVYALGIVEVPAGVSAPEELFADQEEGEESQAPALPKPPAAPTSGPWDTLPLTQQAGIRCNDAAFQNWIGAKDAKEAAERVRSYCKVDSRRHVVRGTQAGEHWLHLDRDFQAFLSAGQADALHQAHARK